MNSLRFNPRDGRVILSLLMLAGTSVTAQAQRLSLAPNIGIYVPTSELVKAAAGQSFKQQVSISVGARLGLTFGQRFGVEASGDYAPSDLTFSAGGNTARTKSKIISGSGKALVFLLPAQHPIAMLVSGGVSVVNRSGAAYPTNTTNVGGALGASLRVRVGGLLSVQLNAEDFLYHARYQGSTKASAVTQHDLHFSFGFGSGF
ncbi:MAG: hypothetical protein ABI587_09935 [Gemmatimonadales bacterium]